MATIIRPSGTIEECSPTPPARAFTLTELQTIVGGYIEALAVPDGRLMILNEDGKRLELPVNLEATWLVADRLIPGDVIVGDVILCTRDEMGEDDDPS